MMKKIAFIHGTLVTGGAEKALINLLRFLDYNQYDVTLWLKDDQGELLSQVDPHVRIRYWNSFIEQDYRQLLKKMIRKGRLFSATCSIFYRVISKLFVRDWYINYKYYLKSLFSTEHTKYDMAIAYQSLRRDDLLFLSYAISAKKKIGWIHGKCSHERNNPYHKTFFKEYPKLNHIFCVSRACMGVFLEKHKSLAKKTSVMYNLQDFDGIRSLANEKVEESFDQCTLVTVGRLSPEKGHDMIPAIAKKLLERGRKFIWFLIGDGPMREKLEKEIIRYGLTETVVLLGQKTNPYPYIKNCSLYVQPSYTEGFCLTTFEAKILNAPIVVTDVSGMREQFPNDEAIICQATVDSLTCGIEKAIDNLSHLPDPLYTIDDSFNNTELQKFYSLLEK